MFNTKADWKVAGIRWAAENAEVICTLSRGDMFESVQKYIAPLLVNLDVAAAANAGNAAYGAAWQIRLLLLLNNGSSWINVDGQMDGRGIRYFGKAYQQDTGMFQCLADVAGALCLVEVSIKANGHGCGRKDCALKRNPETGELYYARVVCGHGDWPCAVCRYPIHPVEACTG